MSTKMLLHKYLGPDAAGGHANFFDPGTSTPKRTYTSTTYSTEEELDVPISSDGWIKTYLLGDYDMDVFDKTGTQLPSASADGINPQAASVANDPNLVVNGSFETDSNEDGTPDSWVLTEYTGSTNSRVSSDQRHGAHAMSFTSTGAGGGYLTTEDFIAVNPDVPMYIGFAIRSTVDDVRNVVDILWFTEAEATVSTTSVYDEDTNNPTSWEFRSFHATPPATAAYAKIRLYGCHSSDSTNGTTLYDDVQFRPAFGNIGIAGNTISSENTNGDINLTPNGTGSVNIQGIPFLQYNQVKVKTALSGVTNSSTLTNDGELIGYSLSEGKYSVEARLIVLSNGASNDMKFKFNPSSGSITGGAAILTFMANTQASSQVENFNIEAEVSLTVSNSVSYLHIYGDIEIPSGGATIDFQFAQNTQESGTATVREGSSITFSRALN